MAHVRQKMTFSGCSRLCFQNHPISHFDGLVKLLIALGQLPVGSFGLVLQSRLFLFMAFAFRDIQEALQQVMLFVPME